MYTAFEGCRWCGGEGRLYEPDDDQYYQCPGCESHTEPCIHCQGSGEVVDPENDENNTMVVCWACNGEKVNPL
jgi:hypothetical protein